jgi:hypothetical protein
MPKYFQRKNLTAIIASTVKENVRKISERCDHELQVNFAQAISKQSKTLYQSCKRYLSKLLKEFVPVEKINVTIK